MDTKQIFKDYVPIGLINNMLKLYAKNDCDCEILYEDNYLDYIIQNITNDENFDNKEFIFFFKKLSKMYNKYINDDNPYNIFNSILIYIFGIEDVKNNIISILTKFIIDCKKKNIEDFEDLPEFHKIEKLNDDKYNFCVNIFKNCKILLENDFIYKLFNFKDEIIKDNFTKYIIPLIQNGYINFNMFIRIWIGYILDFHENHKNIFYYGNSDIKFNLQKLNYIYFKNNLFTIDVNIDHNDGSEFCDNEYIQYNPKIPNDFLL
jgi:hypothetical protein